VPRVLASRLKWTDMDFERKVIRVQPQKHGTPRELKLSDQLIGMIRRLPRKGERVFMANVKTLRSNFAQQRKRMSRKLNNPRLEQIHFHTLRHWRATMEYHRTKSILHVQQLLGHRNIKSTIIYTHLVNFEADSFISRVSKNAKGARALVEAGFEYVCITPEGWTLFRKPK